MKQEKAQKTVFVGVSGGVDSSVAAALLQSQGYRVVGVFIRTWQPDWIECTWQEERRDAMRVCAHLDIPFIELDLEKEYKEGVADYMIAEYRAGRTPNPDVMCNREVKFGGFLNWALAQGADYVATGHYVGRAEHGELVSMLRGRDTNKDQSYFLWTLEQDQLKHILFPLGDMEKKAVRKKAEHFGLPTAQKKDSQGICFIGQIDMKDFLRHYIDEQEGEVHNEAGEVIGSHSGVLFYTLGERHGFVIDPEHKGTNDSPYYVISKDMDANVLVVSQEPAKSLQEKRSISLHQVVDNQGIFEVGMTLEAQIRYRGEIHEIEILSYDGDQMEIEFKEDDPTISAGQSVVIYRGNTCLGGGIIA